MRITLREAQDFRLKGGMWPYLRNPNPYEQTVIIDRGTEYGIVTWDHVKSNYDVEIYLTPEETEMVERGRTAKKVIEAAELLKFAIDKWLLQEKAR
jgi:hypothetical protein